VHDLGIAAQGLAQWVPADAPSETAYAKFAWHVTSGASWLLTARDSLNDVLAFEKAGQLPDPNEPGAALCRAARIAIPAWRQPSGSSLDRDTAVRQLIVAADFLSAATASLAARVPLGHATALQAAGASLAEATASLTAAIQEPGGSTVPGPGQGPAQHQPGDLE
jgi:hypothetical protein